MQSMLAMRTTTPHMSCGDEVSDELIFISPKMIDSVETYERGPEMDKFTKDELKLFDADGFTRNFMKIHAKSVSDEYMDGIRDIVKLQYKLPVRYLKLAPGSYSYIAQKSQIQGKEKDIKNASITIEPLNADYANLIQYTPINQSIPIGTVVTIDESIPFEANDDGTEPERMFIWSSNLKTEPDVESKIKAANPNSIRTKPWMECCHYGCIDIGSHIVSKYVVSEVNTEIMRSFPLFGFRRSDEHKEFVIWVFKCYNMKPKDVLMLMKDHKELGDAGKKFIEEVLSKCK